MPTSSVTWEAAGVVVAVVVPASAFCLKVLSKLERLAVSQAESTAAHRELTKAVRELAAQFTHYRRTNHRAHRRLTGVIASHSERIEDHETRLGSLEGNTDIFEESKPKA